MSDTQQLEQFSQEELVRIVKRDRFVKEQLNTRITALLVENLELLAIVQELQGDNQALQQRATTIEGINMDDVVTTAAYNGGE
jgi:DNA anti-recombination protein RmuC